jgi:Ca2+-transporting ATPase
MAAVDSHPRIADTSPSGAAWHTLPGLDALRALHVARTAGLTAEDAAARLAEFGPNRVAPARSQPRWGVLARQYQDPMQVALLAAGIGSLALGDAATGLAVLCVTILNGVLGLHQEDEGPSAAAALQRTLVGTARVRRGGELQQLAAEWLVPGDMVLIAAGDVVPADGRLVDSATLEVDESALTGESLPVPKGIEVIDDRDAPLGDRTGMLYMTTRVTRGTGEFVVTGTGMATEVGRVSSMLQSTEQAPAPLSLALASLTHRVVAIAGAAVVVALLVDLVRGRTLHFALTAAVAFAVAAMPAGLPTVVTAILAHGTRLLAGVNATARRLWATGTLGSTSAITCDKTGTLTLNEMTAVELALPGRRYTIAGSGYAAAGIVKRVAGQSDVPLEPLTVPLALATGAVVSDGLLAGDPTEGALVVLAEKAGLDVAATREAYPRIAELPFDAAYKLTATFHRMPAEGGGDVVRCFVTGAPDQLLARSAGALGPDLVPVRAGAQVRRRYLAEHARLARQGLRVVATGRRDFNPASFDPEAELLPLVEGLTLLALVGIVDPPRPQARAAIDAARAAGVQVRMVTGDHVSTAETIARRLGLEGRAVTGAELAAMSDGEARRALHGIGVIARATPTHKVRLVEVLKDQGHVVATSGDGVSDAPALQAAHVGIAMGVTAATVAREAAAVVVTDDDLSTIVRAVEAGRGLFETLARYLRFQLGVLAGMILTFLGASVLHIAGGLPFLALQALYATFTTQVLQGVGLACGRPPEGLMARRPRLLDEPILPLRSYRWLAIVGLVDAGATLGVIALAQHDYGTATARTMGLVTFGMLTLLYALTTRWERRSVFSLDTFDRTLLVTSAASLAAIVATAQSGLVREVIETVSLDLRQWLICVAFAATIVVASELRKLRLRGGLASPDQGDAAAPLAT